MIREKSAGAIIFRKEENRAYYLLLHYQAGHWDFPKGNIENGEKEIDTAKREIYEETGIQDVEFIFGFREVIEYFYYRNGQKVYKTVVFYLAKTNTKEVRLSYEHKGYAWLSYEEAIKRVTYKSSKKVLEKAHRYLLAIGEITE
ncbi:MAG: NUDIX domain-containing protein [Candidatus Korarchaeota archaeon]|nr:NUDIX domain-containing protein [Candidatus Korarchaeota archaeon]